MQVVTVEPSGLSNTFENKIRLLLVCHCDSTYQGISLTGVCTGSANLMVQWRLVDQKPLASIFADIELRL